MSDGMSDFRREERKWAAHQKRKSGEYYSSLATSLRAARRHVDEVFYNLDDGDPLNEAVTVSSDALRRAVLRAEYLAEEAKKKDVATPQNAG